MQTTRSQLQKIITPVIGSHRIALYSIKNKAKLHGSRRPLTIAQAPTFSENIKEQNKQRIAEAQQRAENLRQLARDLRSDAFGSKASSSYRADYDLEHTEESDASSRTSKTSWQNDIYNQQRLRMQAAADDVMKPSSTNLDESASSIFAQDSTSLLLKKFMVYKLMGSDLFINHSLSMMGWSYRLFGVRLTNFVINKSVGSLFTAGETIESLVDDIAELEKRGVYAIGNYVVEGLSEMNEVVIQQTQDEIIDAIEAQTEGKSEGHFAVKLTALISTDIMTRLNEAQSIFANEILKYDDKESMSIEDLSSSLNEHGIKFNQEEVEALFDHLKFERSEDKDMISSLEQYANAHLFRLDSSNSKQDYVRGLLRRIALNCGAGVSENDLQIFDKFSERVLTIAEFASIRNCMLYIDAEQTFMQDAIQSFGQQLTHQFNVGDKHIILNGYQCYLKRMAQTLRDEVATSKVFGYNLGVKLIRGAYMNEERALAAEQGYESPVWDTLEDTHECYNESMIHIIDNLKENSMLFVASHNADSVNIAKELIVKHQFGDHRVRFGQLKAFSDQITGELAQENYKVYKYLPYGPTEKVMPYLIRRGQESKQVLREQEFQNVFLKKEIISRIRTLNKTF